MPKVGRNEHYIVIVLQWSALLSDQGVWGYDSRSAGNVLKNLGQTLNPHGFCPPAVMGTSLNESWYCVNGFSCSKWCCILPREMRQ